MIERWGVVLRMAWRLLRREPVGYVVAVLERRGPAGPDGAPCTWHVVQALPGAPGRLEVAEEAVALLVEGMRRGIRAVGE